MKQFLLLMVVFSFLYSSAIAQSKIEFGVNTEGSLLIFGHIPHYSQPKKNTLGAGIGVYASHNIAGKLSADLGVMYRFKQMKEYYDISFLSNGSTGGYGGYSPYGYGSGSQYDYTDLGMIKGWKSYSLNYIVVPFHLNYLVYKNIFVRGGIEASWLTNYDPGKDKTEWNWTLGFGSQYHKLKWSVNYIRGFKDVGFANNLFTIDGMRSATVYRNNMLQLSLSYPLWQKK
jgi:hypothetical protein